MTHPNWCKKPCVHCQLPCALDESIPCSPDCSQLNSVNGEPDGEHCKGCDAICYVEACKECNDDDCIYRKAKYEVRD